MQRIVPCTRVSADDKPAAQICVAVSGNGNGGRGGVLHLPGTPKNTGSPASLLRWRHLGRPEVSGSGEDIREMDNGFGRISSVQLALQHVRNVSGKCGRKILVPELFAVRRCRETEKSECAGARDHQMVKLQAVSGKRKHTLASHDRARTPPAANPPAPSKP